MPKGHKNSKVLPASRLLRCRHVSRESETTPCDCCETESISLMNPAKVLKYKTGRFIIGRSMLLHIEQTSGVHRIEEVTIVLRLLELIDEELDRVGRAHRRQNTAQHEDLL